MKYYGYRKNVSHRIRVRSFFNNSFVLVFFTHICAIMRLPTDALAFSIISLLSFLCNLSMCLIGGGHRDFDAGQGMLLLGKVLLMLNFWRAQLGCRAALQSRGDN